MRIFENKTIFIYIDNKNLNSEEMLNEYAPLSITTAQSILYQLHKLPYAEVQPLCDELLFAINNPITITTDKPTASTTRGTTRPIGFRVDEDEYEEDDNNKITCKKNDRKTI